MTDKELISIVDAKAKKLWNEINTGHEYSIIDSYNQFYGICMEIAEMVQEEPVSVWHDTGENPKEEEYLICVCKDNRYHVGKIYKDEFDRLLVSDNKNIIELCMFKKWAYLDDILKLSNVQRTLKLNK